MLLAEDLLATCEEFFEHISTEELPELEHAVAELRSFLEREVDGWTSYPDESVAYAVQCRLSEIWSLIPEDHKISAHNLQDYFDVLMEELVEITRVEPDEMDSLDEVYP